MVKKKKAVATRKHPQEAHFDVLSDRKIPYLESGQVVLKPMVELPEEFLGRRAHAQHLIDCLVENPCIKNPKTKKTVNEYPGIDEFSSLLLYSEHEIFDDHDFPDRLDENGASYYGSLAERMRAIALPDDFNAIVDEQEQRHWVVLFGEVPWHVFKKAKLLKELVLVLWEVSDTRSDKFGGFDCFKGFFKFLSRHIFWNKSTSLDRYRRLAAKNGPLYTEQKLKDLKLDKNLQYMDYFRSPFGLDLTRHITNQHYPSVEDHTRKHLEAQTRYST